jgi:hypothetical protein
VGSKGRSGQPLASGEQAITAVWVDLAGVFGPSNGNEGLVVGVVPGGLQRWIRSTAGWVGVVTYVVRMADGSSYKAVEQLVPARALRPR